MSVAEDDATDEARRLIGKATVQNGEGHLIAAKHIHNIQPLSSLAVPQGAHDIHDSHRDHKRPRWAGPAANTGASHCGGDGFETLHVVPSHPFGVRPNGNALLSGSSTVNYRSSMGGFARMPHELMLSILSLLSPMDLARLERTSRALRAFAAHEPVWRDALIQHTHGHLRFWKGSWKTTMAAHLRIEQVSVAVSSPPSRVPHEADTIREPSTCPLYSDLLFLPLQLASLPLSRFTPSSSNSGKSHREPYRRIERATMDSLTKQSFLDRFASKSVPCLLTGQKVGPQDELPNWTIEDVRALYPSRRIRAEALTMSMDTYATYARTCSSWDGCRAGWIPDESPFYLFDPNLAHQMQSEGRFVVPKLFREEAELLHGSGPGATGRLSSESSGVMARSWDLFSLLHDRRPDHTWIIAGPKRSGSGWHVDPNHTSAYNTVLSGRKLWMLLPPHITPPGVFISHDGATVTAPLSIAEWLTDFWLHCVQQHGRRGDNTLIVDVCGPGETIYVPAGWKHLVVNLEESVAFTQNFVSPAELPAVMDFLKNRPEQISGFRMRHRRMQYTSAEDSDGDASDPELDELPNDGIEEKRKLFDLFVERLRSFDEEMCRAGLQAMRALEAQREDVRHADSSRHYPTRVRERKLDGIRQQHATTWWQSLKHREADEGQNLSALCLAVAGQEELELEPW